MTSPDSTTPPAPVYAAAFEAYWQAGWRGVLPLPPRAKKYPPRGWTGNDGAWPSYPDLYTWAEDTPDANLALRLPETVIGIDVDAYPGKAGAATLANAEAGWGRLPRTWRTTSRDDGVSGIRLYRVPAGLAWPNEVGPGIETVRHAHRYAVAWPSIHPDTARTYRWINPDGLDVAGHIPTPDDLPLLPAAWVQGLTNGQQANPAHRQALTGVETAAWVARLNNGPPCRAVTRALEQRLTDLAAAGSSRHDMTTEGTARIAHLGAEGHRGAPAALAQLRGAFLAAALADGSRTEREAEAEWDRQLIGAIHLAAAAPASDVDPCDDPFAGLVDRAPASPAQQLATAAAAVTATTVPTAEPPHASTSPGEDSEALDTQEAPPVPSWAPVDLGPYLDGTHTPETPTLLRRADGACLIYPGLVHDFHGESESGKSLIAQAEAATRIQAGDDVLYVDFESGPHQLVGRLLALGCTPDEVADHFTYVRPEVSPYALAEAPAWAGLLARTFTLAILDGVTDALGQFGAGTKENDDIAAWHRAVPRMLTARTGAAVILVDHVVKNGDTRGRFALGGQAKMAAIDGASYVVEITEPIGKGMRGVVTLRIGKDRPGEIRPICGKWRALDRTQEAARVTVDSTGPTGRIDITVDAPLSHVSDGQDDGKPFKPTGVMERLSRLLETRGEAISYRKLLEAYKADGGTGRERTVADAVDRLIEAGHLSEESGPRNARMLRSAAVYRQRTDPDSDSYVAPLSDLIHPTSSPSPDRLPPTPGDGEGTVSATVSPEGETETVTRSQHGRPSPKPEGRHVALDRASGEWYDLDTGEVVER